MNKVVTYSYLFCTFLILTLFTENSCSNNRDRNSVYTAERLLDSRPDSALTLLESIDFPEDLPEKEYAKYCQLLVSAHQKNKIIINEDTLIIKAVDYYKAIDNGNSEHIKSLLLLGNVYEERDSVLQAEQCYLEGFELSGQIKEMHLRGVSAFELGGLCKYLGDYDKSINWFNIAIQAFSENDNQRMKRRSMRQIADCYVLSGNIDTALILYNNILIQIPPQKQNVKADIYKNIAITYKKAGYYDQSLYFIKKSIETTSRESLYPIQYKIMASIYETAGNQDSSTYYNQVALQYAKKQRNPTLIEINQPHSFDNYILSRSLSDSSYQKQKYESVKYQKLYNTEKIKKKNKALTIKLQRYIFLSLLLLLGCILYYLYLLDNKKKKQLQLEQEIEVKNNIIHSIRDSLFQRLVIYKKMVRLYISPHKEKHKPFLKEYNKMLFDKDNDNEFAIDWNILYNLSNNIFNNYAEKLCHLYPLFNDIEQKMIILQKLSFNPTEISAILEKSIHTIYKYSSNIRKKLNISENDSVIDFIDKSINT